MYVCVCVCMHVWLVIQGKHAATCTYLIALQRVLIRCNHCGYVAVHVFNLGMRVSCTAIGMLYVLICGKRRQLFSCVCVHVCLHVCMCVFICCVNVRVCVCVCIYIHIYDIICICIRTYMNYVHILVLCACMHVCTQLHTFMYVRMYIHKHAHANRPHVLTPCLF
jgi:hypothetical protein